MFHCLLLALMGLQALASNGVKQEYECKPLNEREPMFYDPTCSDDFSEKLGCNAGGLGQNCRFCNFGPFQWPCHAQAATTTTQGSGVTEKPQTAAPIKPGDVVFSIINNCKQDLWIGMQGRSRSNGGWELPFKGGWKLPAGQRTDLGVPQDLDAARLWGRTGCRQVGSRFVCETGDCGFEQCAHDGVQRGGRTPVTLAEFTLNGWGEQDYYDVSLVDGYNLMMSIDPKDKSSTHGAGEYWCTTPNCLQDLNLICPPELRYFNSNKEAVACLSACEALQTDQYCCRGAHNRPETCKSTDWPVNYPSIFKQACPTAYSYAYDDHTSTFFCKNTGYDIIFC